MAGGTTRRPRPPEGAAGRSGWAAPLKNRRRRRLRAPGRPLGRDGSCGAASQCLPLAAAPLSPAGRTGAARYGNGEPRERVAEGARRRRWRRGAGGDSTWRGTAEGRTSAGKGERGAGREEEGKEGLKARVWRSP